MELFWTITAAAPPSMAANRRDGIFPTTTLQSEKKKELKREERAKLRERDE
jgi:hypothetical protein